MPRLKHCLRSLRFIIFWLSAAGLLTPSLAVLAQQEEALHELDTAKTESVVSTVIVEPTSDISSTQCDTASLLASARVTVAAARYLQGAANQLEGNSAYSHYMARIANRRSQQYYSGDDGRLYALDTLTGEQRFTFTPAATVFASSVAQRYQHYPVTAPVVADIYDGAQWRTILVGRSGVTSQGLFALDITHPDAIQTLWELDESTEVLTELEEPLDYRFPQPSIARLHNGRWAVITGYDSQAQDADNGTAALHIIDAMSGSLIKRLEVQSALAKANALSSPRLADYDGDGIADYAYAGDLHGNLWRFDLLGDAAVSAQLTAPLHASYGTGSGSSARFAVSYAGSPMFIARAAAEAVRQPIIAAPSLVPHPTGKGYLVLFGTGSTFASTVRADESSVHSLYAIWDMKTSAEMTVTDTVSDDQLALQSITSASIGIAQKSGQQREARVISNNLVEWYVDFDRTKAVKQRGWRLDFPDGEMLVENMRTVGSMLLVQTLVPSADPCVTAASHWLYAINPASGGALMHHAFETQTAEAGIASAIKFAGQGAVDLAHIEQGLVVRTRDDQELIAPPAQSMGRQSWRMISEP